MDRQERERMLAGFQEQREIIERECPGDLEGSWRNQEETMALSLASSDESRIRILAGMALDGAVDPHNGLFFYDLAVHFRDPSRAQEAQRVAQYHQLPTNFLGRLERGLRRVIHPGINRFVDVEGSSRPTLPDTITE